MSPQWQARNLLKGKSKGFFLGKYKLIRQLGKNHETLITIEEGSIGGFGSFVLEFLAREDLLHDARIKTMHLPDIFQDQDKPDAQYEDAGLVAQDIANACL